MNNLHSQEDYTREEKEEYNKSFLRKEFEDEYSSLIDDPYEPYLILEWLFILVVIPAVITFVVGFVVYLDDQLFPKLLHFFGSCLFLLAIGSTFFKWLNERREERKKSVTCRKISNWAFGISGFLGMWLMFYMIYNIKDILSSILEFFGIT